MLPDGRCCTHMSCTPRRWRWRQCRCYGEIFRGGRNPDEREYYDDADQIREVLIHANYFSQKDIEDCLGFDIDSLSGHAHFESIKALFAAYLAEYTQQDD